MNKDTEVVVGELRDVAKAVDAVAATVRDRPEPELRQAVVQLQIPNVEVKVPKQATPIVNVNVDAQQPPPIVQVTVPPAPVAEIIFPPHLPSAYVVDIIERDSDGFIQRFTITPIG